jgi:hypothetical protein
VILMQMAAVIVVGFLVMFLLNTWKSKADAKRGIKPKAANAPTPAWVWVFLIAVVATITYLIKPSNPKGPMAPPAPGVGGVTLWTILLPLILFVGLIAIAYLKGRDPLVGRALKRSRERDREGAIEMLREGIDSGRATGIRLNNLGVLYSESGDHAGALKRFQDAEKLEARQPVFLLNQVDSLRRLGRPTEAADLLEEVHGGRVIEFYRDYHTCLILADLGHFAEAREALARAERVRVPGFFSKANREARTKLILECRDRLEGMPRDMSRSGELNG